MSLWLSLKLKLRNPFLFIGGILLPSIILWSKVNSVHNYEIAPKQYFVSPYIGISMMTGILLIGLLGFPMLYAQRQQDNVLKRLTYFGIDKFKYYLTEFAAYFVVMAISVIVSVFVGHFFLDLSLPNPLHLISFLLHILYVGVPVTLFGLVIAQIIKRPGYVLIINGLVLLALYYYMGIFSPAQLLKFNQQYLTFSFPLTSLLNYELYAIWINHVLIHTKFLIVTTSLSVLIGLVNTGLAIFKKHSH